MALSASTVRRWATKARHHDACPHVKDGRGRLRFNPDEVDEWLTRTGVLKRSKAQTRHAAPPLVPITDAIRWTPEHVTDPDLDDDEREVVALHRTIKTCLHVCTQSDQLPTPPADLDREAAAQWLLALDPRTVADWQRLAAQPLENTAALLDAIHG